MNLHDKKFYEFAFSVAKKNVPDIYSDEKEFYVMHGPWDEWGYLEFWQSEKTLRFAMYVQTDNMEIKKDLRDDHFTGQRKTELYKDGKIFAYETGGWRGGQTKHDMADFDFYRKWNEVAVLFSPANGEDRNITQADLTDGKYEIKIELNGIPFAYPFEVKGGKVQLDPRQDRSKNPDPFTLIEAKKDKFFIKNTTGKISTIPVSPQK